MLCPFLILIMYCRKSYLYFYSFIYLFIYLLFYFQWHGEGLDPGERIQATCLVKWTVVGQLPPQPARLPIRVEDLPLLQRTGANCQCMKVGIPGGEVGDNLDDSDLDSSGEDEDGDSVGDADDNRDADGDEDSDRFADDDEDGDGYGDESDEEDRDRYADDDEDGSDDGDNDDDTDNGEDRDDDDQERVVPEIIQVVGSMFEDRYQRALTEMRRIVQEKGATVTVRVVHKPNNPCDKNALKFEAKLSGSWSIFGYVPKKKIPKVWSAMKHNELVISKTYRGIIP